MLFDYCLIKLYPPYILREVNTKETFARSCGEGINISGMGNPVAPPAHYIVDKLVKIDSEPNIRRYFTTRGITVLRRADAKVSLEKGLALINTVLASLKSCW